MTYVDEVLADAPIAYYRFGEASGTVAHDSSGNGHDETISYGTSGNTFAFLGIDGLITDADTAIHFIGNSIANTGCLLAPGTTGTSWMAVSNLTLECWIKTTQGGSGFMALWDRDNSPRVFQHRLNKGKPEFVRITNAAGSMSVVTCSSTATVNDGLAHHIVTTYDGTTIKNYIDGVLNGTAAAAGGLLASATADLAFGRSPGGVMVYTGDVDEIAYYGTALSAERVAAHYNAGISAPETPPMTMLAPAASLDVQAVVPRGRLTYPIPVV